MHSAPAELIKPDLHLRDSPVKLHGFAQRLTDPGLECSGTIPI